MPLEIDAALYLEAEGRNCPACKLPGVWREHRSLIPITQIKGVRLLFVRCNCTRCGAGWTETYLLVGVHNDRDEALAAAKTTYKSTS